VIYIRHKLSRVSASDTIISEAALPAIHGYVQGKLRLIDNIMTDALTIDAQMQKKVIDEEVVLAAASNQKFMVLAIVYIQALLNQKVHYSYNGS